LVSIVGFSVVLQTTPRAVAVEPPVFLTMSPPIKKIEFIPVTSIVKK
jgi:hypothetical protein